MNKSKLTILVLSLFSLIQSFAQNAEVMGVILDNSNNPIENINVISNLSGTTTNSNGFYSISVPSNQDISIEFTHINYKKISLKFNLNEDEVFEFNPIMDESIEQIATIVLNSRSRDNFSGVSNINPEVIRKIRGAQPGVENLLKTLPGVNISNELSTQYSVRGGNFDENLVYVNDVEVYRPFLVRSGQQEGLSFVNTDLIKSVKFSSGGFQSKYGDKMSSVLDIKYRKPVKNKLSSNLNLLGSRISSDLISDNSKALKQIEDIVHPLVACDRQLFIEQAEQAVLVFDIPLLYETHSQHQFDAVACVYISPEEQRRRVMDRGTMTAAQLDYILSKQMPIAKKRELSHYQIKTDSLVHVMAQVSAILADIREQVVDA